MSPKKLIAGVILAAGMSQRFGQPKQLLRLKNKYLLEWVLDAALTARLQTVVLVLGHKHQTILQALGSMASHPRLQIVINHRYAEGQSQSLKAGLLKVHKTHSAVMFLLGDQPLLRSDTIDDLLERFWHSDKDMGVPLYRGKRGNPTLFRRTMYCKLIALQGDIGAREIIRANPARVQFMEVDDPLCFLDIDSPKDFENLQNLKI
jgi:molybdenum cofactor cytidylyltransferase